MTNAISSLWQWHLKPRLVGALSIPQTAMPTSHFGSKYGGRWIPSKMLTQDSLVYAAGVGEDVSFELEVSRHFGCRIVLFDPTPKAISYIETIRDQFDVGISIEPFGSWVKTMNLKFFPPADPSHASFSALNLQSTSEPVSSEWTILAQCGETGPRPY